MKNKTSGPLPQPSTFKAERISRQATIHVNAPLDKTFPLFGPVLEKLWAPGWEPEVIFSKDAEVEEHMIFRTPGHHETEPFYTWTVTQYQPARGLVEYTVQTTNRIWFVRVVCQESGASTDVTVSYTYTGLNDLGNQLNKLALDNMFAENLTDWQQAINEYLKTSREH